MGILEGAKLGTAQRLTAGLVDHHRPSWSPDRSMIAYCAGLHGSSQVFLCDDEGRFIRQVTEGGGLHAQPAWSPDGRLVAYAWRKTESGRWQVWISHRDPGEAAQCVLTSTRFSYSHPSFFASGEGLYFHSNQGAGATTNIWEVHFEGGRKSQVFDDPERHNLNPAANIDGRWLVFEAGVDPAAASDLVLLDLKSGQQRVLTDGEGRNTNPSFVSPTVVVYENHTADTEGVLWLMDVVSGGRRRLTDPAQDAVQGGGWLDASGTGKIAWSSRIADPRNERYDVVVATFGPSSEDAAPSAPSAAAVDVSEGKGAIAPPADDEDKKMTKPGDKKRDKKRSKKSSVAGKKKSADKAGKGDKKAKVKAKTASKKASKKAKISKVATGKSETKKQASKKKSKVSKADAKSASKKKKKAVKNKGEAPKSAKKAGKNKKGDESDKKLAKSAKKGKASESSSAPLKLRVKRTGSALPSPAEAKKAPKKSKKKKR